MTLSLKTLPILALLAWSTPLLAQETPDATTEAPAAAAPAEAPAQGEGTPDLSMGEAADAAAGEPQVGQPYVREEFGDWALRCMKTEDGNDPCQLYQLLQDDEGNAVAEISMFPLPEGQEAVAGAEIVAPLMTLLTENLTMSVDGANGRRYPFSFCNAAGCVARVGFTAAEVDQFRNGNAGLLSLVPAMAADQHVDLAISLSGFTAGYEAVVAAAAARATSGEAPESEVAPAE